MKKIALLYNLNRGKYEYETEFDSEITINKIYDCLKKKYEIKRIEAMKDFLWISEIQKYNPDLVFNICEGYNGPARESVYAAILEQFNYNYTGPDSTNLLICHNKYMVKKILEKEVLVPFGYSINKLSDLENIDISKYPVIVKLNSEGSSMGLSRKSIVNNREELQKQVEWLLNKYKRNVIIEEYIEGKDMSMTFIEGIGALGPCFIDCNSVFYDYEMKTTKDNEVNIKPANKEYKELKKIVELIAKKLDIKGYAKMDFRISQGKYYLIEVNSQVSFHPLEEFITCAKNENLDFDYVINYIVDKAFQNKEKENSFGIR